MSNREPRKITNAKDAIAITTIYAAEGPEGAERLLLAKVSKGPAVAYRTMAGLLSLTGSLLIEAAEARGVTVEEMLQQIAVEFARMDDDT